jgi:hypothetical protein
MCKKCLSCVGMGGGGGGHGRGGDERTYTHTHEISSLQDTVALNGFYHSNLSRI